MKEVRIELYNPTDGINFVQHYAAIELMSAIMPFPEFQILPYETPRDKTARWYNECKDLRRDQDLWVSKQIAIVYLKSFDSPLNATDFKAAICEHLCVRMEFRALESVIRTDDADLEWLGLRASWTYTTSTNIHYCRVFIK